MVETKLSEETSYAPDAMNHIWQRAQRTDILRMLCAGTAAAVFAFVVMLLDTDHWPPRFRQPLSDAVPWAVGVAALVAVFFGATTYLQKGRAPQRYVSPLLGLPADQRRAATANIDHASPSDDPELRQIETMRAEQLVQTAPSTVPYVLIQVAIQAAVMVMMFVSGSPALGLLWAIVAGLNARSGYRGYRRGQAARHYLSRLSEHRGNSCGTAG